MKESIRKAISLTELISTYTTVKGNKALCPFHPDTNPSLSISESKGLWHCFVCGVGGDAFSFVMRKEGVSFHETIKILSGRCGITQAYNSPRKATEAKRQMEIRNFEILRLKRIREDELARLNEHDSFMSNLWKEVYRSSRLRREVILEAIEECFMIIEEEHKQLEGWYENESRKVYRKALLQSSGRSCVSQI